MHNTYRPSTFSVMLQLKDLISEFFLARVGVLNIIFRKTEHGDLLLILA